MEFIKRNRKSLITVFLEILVGILLLINPTMFTSIIIIILGVGFAILGLVDIVKYFQNDVVTGATGQFFTKGILYLLFGCFCVFKHDWFIGTFPVLTTMYGILVLITGVSKLQSAIDLVRIRHPKWFLTGITSVVTILCAVFILCNPFKSVEFMWWFIGLSLIVEAVVDIIVIILSHKGSTIIKEVEVDEYELKPIITTTITSGNDDEE